MLENIFQLIKFIYSDIMYKNSFLIFDGVQNADVIRCFIKKKHKKNVINIFSSNYNFLKVL